MDITLNRINDSISRGIDFLGNFQLPDGEFPSYRTDKKMGPADWLPDSAVFPTALVSHSLRYLEGSYASEIRKSAKRFLLGEMRAPGVWTYWSSKSGISIPPDLDDTCCAAAILMEDRPEIYRANASIILNNRNQDGLFFTWLKPPADRQNDIDSVVNANVLFYLKNFEGIEKVVDHLCSLITTHQEDASYWYYLSPAAFYYMITRAYAGGVQKLEVCSEAIAAKIIQDRLKTGRFSTATETALDLCTLANLGIDDPIVTRPAVEFLIDCQQETGSWPRERFYAGPPPPGTHTVWFGSEALTTAFCLEALARMAGLWG